MSEKNEKKSGDKHRTKKIALATGIGLLPMIGFSSPIETLYEGDFYLDGNVTQENPDVVDLKYLGNGIIGNYIVISIGLFYNNEIPKSSLGYSVECTLTTYPANSSNWENGNIATIITSMYNPTSVGGFSPFNNYTAQEYVSSSQNLYLNCINGAYDLNPMLAGNYHFVILGYKAG